MPSSARPSSGPSSGWRDAPRGGPRVAVACSRKRKRARASDGGFHQKLIAHGDRWEDHPLRRWREISGACMSVVAGHGLCRGRGNDAPGRRTHGPQSEEGEHVRALRDHRPGSWRAACRRLRRRACPRGAIWLSKPPGSQALAGRLATELVGHAAVGHLRININEMVQGDQIVLEGVESREATALAQPLQRAVDGPNQAATGEPNRERNMTQREADAIAGQLSVHEP